MKYLIGDTWKVKNNFDGCVIPLNCCVQVRPNVSIKIVKKTLYSKFLRSLYHHKPHLITNIADNLEKYGNHVCVIDDEFIGMPVLESKYCAELTSWVRVPPLYQIRVPILDLSIIEQSCKELILITDKLKWSKVLVVRPNSLGVNWIDVKNIMKKYLDDRFYIINYFCLEV